jgi:pyridinium-3,5-bisthiocarboxylic acid mononucleotide nickel chelatase
MKRYGGAIRGSASRELERVLEIHLDPLGGWSGDMFVAALLDAFPEFWPSVQATVASLQLGAQAECRLVPHRDHVLTGSRFLVGADSSASSGGPAHLSHDHSHSHSHDHREHAHVGHRAWADIRADLAGSDLDASIREHAIAIFALLAKAEAKVHGVEEDAVAFHEVGAIDSIVDIVAAARLIALIGAGRWTSGPLPLGSGRIKTAHGVLPVPAPATAILMQGLATIDDGVAGERVTPTGAAIARYLLASDQPLVRHPRRLSRSGTGFGARTMPGISNCLRMLAFDEAPAQTAGPIGRRQLAVIAFEVDDQSAEDLAAGLDHIRALPGILDVTQGSVLGKKGRMAVHVQVLVAPAELENAIAACFQETTTIGLRYQITDGAVLRRRFDTVEIDGEKLQVKIVDRPGGEQSAKTEISEVARLSGHVARERLRRDAVAQALGGMGPAETRVRDDSQGDR